MARHEEIYDLLLDYANIGVEIDEVVAGAHWTLCRANAVGLSRTINSGVAGKPHSRPLRGRPLAELALWLRKWDRRQSAIGLAAVNAAINREADMVYMEGALFKGQQAVQGSFEWFVPQLLGQSVVAAGPAAAILRNSGVGDVVSLQLPGAIPPEAEQLLPKADWVFLPAETIADKTLPRLLELAEGAECVLYGTEAPWLEEWGDFGVTYLVGSQIDDNDLLSILVSEGVEQLDVTPALSYRIINFHNRLRSFDAQAVKARNLLLV